MTAPRRASVAIAIAFAFGGCAELTLPESNPRLSGLVAATQPLAVESSTHGVVAVTTDDNTRYLRTDADGSLHRTHAYEIKIGSMVRIWTSGALTPGGAAQAHADVIELVIYPKPGPGNGRGE